MNSLLKTINVIQTYFPPGYKIIDAISSGDRIGSTWWSVFVCTSECYDDYNHKQGTSKNTECRPHRCLTFKV